MQPVGPSEPQRTLTHAEFAAATRGRPTELLPILEAAALAKSRDEAA